MTGPREIHVAERPEVPWLSLVFGYGPMLPFVLGAIEVWSLVGASRANAIVLTVVWGASILSFLAGVRRGISFRTSGGPQVAQIITMFCLFVLALTATGSVVFRAPTVAVSCLFIGYVGVMVLDPIAARGGQAPLFFARLRPLQMAIAVLSLGAILANLLLSRS